MKSNKCLPLQRLSALLLAGAALATAVDASAQILTDDRMHFYVGGNYGGFKARGGAFEDENDYMEAVAGLRINPYVGLEGSYANFGEYGSDFASAELDGFGVAAMGSLPLSGTTSLYAKAGMFFSQFDVEFAGFDEGYSDEQPFYGLGVDFAFFDPVMVSLEYDRYKVQVEDAQLPLGFDSSDTDIDTVKVGIKFVF